MEIITFPEKEMNPKEVIEHLKSHLGVPFGETCRCYPDWLIMPFRVTSKINVSHITVDCNLSLDQFIVTDSEGNVLINDDCSRGRDGSVVDVIESSRVTFESGVYWMFQKYPRIGEQIVRSWRPNITKRVGF